MNCYHHFTIEERTCLRKYYMEGLSFRKIAKLLGRIPSSISREIARNYTSRYRSLHLIPQVKEILLQEKAKQESM